MEAIEKFASLRPRVHVASSLGQPGYFSAMCHAEAMVGNSSSGIIEAATFGLPVVNVGDRQTGRVRGRNVIDVPCRKSSIRVAVARACTAEFRLQLRQLVNPYGDGGAAARIVAALATAPLGARMLRKAASDTAAPLQAAFSVERPA